MTAQKKNNADVPSENRQMGNVRNRSRAIFTLIELLVVIAIIAIILTSKS